MKRNRRSKRFVLCVYNEGYPVSLELRKIYEQLPDPIGEKRGFVRVIDESGEDYLFPSKYFLPLDLPKSVEAAIESAAELEIQHR
jgi:hypothetical protein